VLATLFWSGNFVVGRTLRGQVEPIALNFWRWLIAAVVLAPFVWRGFRQQWPLLKRHWRYVALLGFTGLALPHACIYEALRTTTAVNALLLLIMMPVVVAIGAWRFFGQPVEPRQWGGIAVCLAGAVSILVRWDWQALVQLRFHEGDLLMIPAVLGASAHALLLRRTPAGVTQGPLLLASMVAAVLLMSAAAGWRGVATLSAIVNAWPGALYVGVCASAIAFLLWNRGVMAVGAERAAPLMYAMPVYASVLSAVFLGEGMHAYQLAGGSLVLAGLWVARRRAGPRTVRT
jgi:drug/metabolite transporter (DMT)-like permease